MNATSDYEAARAFLKPHLPAYVTYTVDSRAGFDAIKRNQTETLTVRTSDGKIVKGKEPDVKVDTGSGNGDRATQHAPFDAACYTAKSARLTTFESRSLEAISLSGGCETNKKEGEDSDTDFQTLYVDPQTREPVIAIGTGNSNDVAVHLEQRFVKTQGYVMPASFHIHVKGSGLMFWLDVLADQTFSNYRFTDTIPH